MTVGLAFHNGKEAVGITDSRVSGGGRESDSVDKMGEFSGDKYSGVVFGTGNGNLIEGVIRHLGRHEEEGLEKFLMSVHGDYKDIADQFDRRVLAAEREEIEKKAFIIRDEKEKEKFIKESTAHLQNNFADSKNNEATHFVMIGYDARAERLRQFQFGSKMYSELFRSHVEIGSGADGANIHFGTKLQGIDTRKLGRTDLAFFTTNAYCLSTIDQGVGGTPKIATVSSDGTVILPTKKAMTLVNLSGAYLSEFNHDALSSVSTRALFGKVMNGDPDYEGIAKILEVNEDTLTSAYIPYAQWQERSNRRLFKDAAQE